MLNLPPQRHEGRITCTRTNLSLPSCALLDHGARHGAADGKTLENTSDGVTQTQGDEFLHREKHTIYTQYSISPLKQPFIHVSMHYLPTWLLSTLYPYFRAKIRPSEMAMP